MPRFPRPLSPTLFLLSLGALLLGCPDGTPATTDTPVDDGSSTGTPPPTTTDDCPVGALGCVCTMGGACDPGLVCVDAQCESAPESTSSGPVDDSTTDGVGDTTDGSVGTDTGADASTSGSDEESSGESGDMPGAVMPGTHSLPIGHFDLVLDDERDQVFVSYGASGEVMVVDLVSGGQTTVTTGHRAEALHFDPDRDEVVVSLPIADHSSYWWDDEQEGYVGAIDALTLDAPTPVWLPLDPWDIVSDGTGTVYVAGGSGQWTSAAAVELGTGWFDLAGSVRQRTNIRVHPMLDRIYGADNGLSPSDIERWNLVGGTVQPSYDSPYHGTYPMCGELRIHPSGSTIYTRCGHIFLATNSAMSDMTWTADLGLTWIDLDFDPPGDTAYLLVDGAPMLYAYDTATLSPAGAYPLAGPALRLLTGPQYVVLAREVLGGMPHLELEVVMYSDL